MSWALGAATLLLPGGGLRNKRFRSSYSALVANAARNATSPTLGTAAVVLSPLVDRHAVNGYNAVVRSIWSLVIALTEPLLRPIRGTVSDFRRIDISPIILLWPVSILELIIEEYNYPVVYYIRLGPFSSPAYALRRSPL